MPQVSQMLTNIGVSDAANITISDNINNQISNVSWTASATGRATITQGSTGTGNSVSISGNVPAGGSSIVVTITGKVAPGASGTLVNFATVQGPDTPPTNSDTTTTLVKNKPGLQISKSGPAQATAGARVRYTLGISNSGPSNASGVNITDQIPAALRAISWTSITSGGAVITSGATGSSNNLAIVANIPADSGRVVVTIDAQLNPSAAGTVTNTATAAVSGGTPVSSTVQTLVVSNPVLSISKSGPATAHAGEQVTYTLVATNTGISDAMNVIIQDVVPAPLTNVSWNATVSDSATIISGATGTGSNVVVTGNLPAGTGNHIFVTVTGTLPPSFTGTFNNMAAAFMKGRDTVTSENVTTTVTRLSALQIVKGGFDSTAAGGPVHYEITVTNNGPSDAAGIAISDTIDAHISNVTWAAVAAGNAHVVNGSGTGNIIKMAVDIPAGSGNSVVLKIDGTVDPAFTGDIRNTATATVPGQPPVGSDTVTTHVVNKPAVKVLKSGPAQLAAGQQVSWVIIVSNNGPSNAAGITIKDTIPAGVSNVSWTTTASGTSQVTAGGTGTGNIININGNVTPGNNNTIQVMISGTVNAGYTGTSLLNKAVVNVPGQPTVTDTVSTQVLRKPGLGIVKTGPGTLSAGDQLTYTITVTNSGPSDAANVVILDTLNAALRNISWTAVPSGAGTTVSAPSGTSNIININGNIPAGSANKVVITVKATLSPDFTGTSLVNNATATPPGLPGMSSNVTSTVTRNIDIRVVKSGPANAVAGEAITYTITVTNAGPANAVGALITDILPPNILNARWTATANNARVSAASGTGNVNITADIPALPNASVVIVINGRINGAVAAGVISNTVTATPQVGQTDNTPAISTVNTNITRSADLVIVKSGPANSAAGQDITWQLLVTNNGISDVTGALIQDAIPAAVTIKSVTTATQGTAAAGMLVVTGNNISLNADIAAGTGNTVIVTIKGTIASSATGTLTNTATVAPPADVTETVPANNTSTINTAITSDVGLQLSKAGPASVNVGDTIRYTILMSNTGLSNADSVVMTDNIPAAITNVSWTATAINNASVAPASGTGNAINLLAMLGGNMTGSVRVDIKGIVSKSAPNTIVNTVTAVFNGTKTSSVVTSVNKSANLRLSKTGPATLAAGQPITYVIKVNNAGSADALGASINDAVPAGINNISWTATATSGATVSPANGTSSSIALTASIPAYTDTITLTINGIVAPGFSGTLVNTATATPPPGVTNPIPATATVSTVVTSQPGIVIAKSGPAQVLAGNTITYQLDVRNNGPSDATGVSVKDTVPAALSNVSWTVIGNGTPVSGAGAIVNVSSNLPVDSSISIIITGTTDPAFSGKISNHATAGNVSSNTINTNVINQPGLQVSKSGPAQIAGGELITYVINVSNTGPSAATATAISDVIPAGINNVTWSATASGTAAINGGNISNANGNVALTGNIPAGSGNNIMITVKGTVNPAASGTLTNVVSATPNNGTPVTTTAISKIVNQPGIRMQKSGPDQAAAGNSITYTVNVYNDGPSDATNISIADVIPAQLQQAVWSATAAGGATINGGNVSNQTGNVALTANIPAGTANMVQVQITGVITPSYTGNITNTATGTVNGQPISSNTVTTKVMNKPGVQLTKSGPSTAPAGGNITYTLVLTNAGPSDATGIMVSDTLPAALQQAVWSATAAGAATINGGNISNQSGNVTFTANVPAGAANKVMVTIMANIPSSFNGTLTNVAGYTTNGITTPTPPVNTTVQVKPGLTLSKSGPDTIAAGTQIVYTLLAANNGPSDAANVTISDLVPAAVTNVSWTTSANGATLNSGSTGSGNNIQITGSITAGGNIAVTVTGTIASNATGAVLNKTLLTYNGNTAAQDSANTIVVNRPGVSVNKSGPPQVNAGGAVTYSIDVTNAGPSDLRNALIKDMVPAVIRNVSWNISVQGSAVLAAGTAVSGTGNAISFQGDIPAGNVNHIRITVNGTADPDSSGTVTNTAIVTDANGNVYTGGVSTRIVKQWRLYIVKSGPAAVNAGNGISYLITATNLGPSNAKGITITDVVPAAITNVSCTAVANGNAAVKGGAAGTGNNIVVMGDIAGGAGNSIQVIINGVVPSNATAATINNVATLKRPDSTTTTTPPVPTVITRRARITIVKQAPSTANAGDSIHFLLTVTNAGPSDATGITINDRVPAAITGVSWKATASGAAQVTANATGTGSSVSLQGNVPVGAANNITIQINGVVASNFSGTITNTAVAVNGTDSIPSNTTQTSITGIAAMTADLAVTKSGPAQVGSGEHITYTIVARNNGPARADSAVITDILPASLQNADGSIVATTGGAVAQISISDNVARIVATSFPAGATIRIAVGGITTGFGILSNSAVIQPPAHVNDPDMSNNTSATIVTAVQGADVEITKTLATNTPLVVGGRADFNISVKNNGPSTSKGITVRDTLRDNLELIGGATAGIGLTNYDPVSKILIWTIDSLQLTQTATLNFSTRITNTGIVANLATVATQTLDPIAENNVAVTSGQKIMGDDIFIPNVITPNGDGKNDKFVIIGISRYPNSSLFIYNRWGNEVYQSKNYQNTWDGHDLNEGTYFYVLKLNTPNGERAYKGWIELLR